MTTEDFRRIALGMKGAVEGAHMNHPDFRANGKIFATIYPGGKQGMVKLTPEQQAEFIRLNAAAFTPASGAWGRQGCTMVSLAVAEEETIGEAMTLAWQATVRDSAANRPAKSRRQQATVRSRRKNGSPARRPKGRPR
jgi:hypothetical protein